MMGRLRQMLVAASAVALGLGGWAALGVGSASAQSGRQPQTHGPGSQHGRGGEHAQDANPLLLDAPMAPSVPTDPAVFGVKPGLKPWVIAHGHVRLGANGTLRLAVARLIVPAVGKNPLSAVDAAVYCNGTLAATTPPAPFSVEGDANIAARVALPAFCPAPAVLLQTVATTTDPNVMYIAFDGQGSFSSP